MTVPNGWKRAGAPDRDDVVLAVDFEAIGRPEASFRDLIPAVEAAAELWTAVPPPVPVPAEPFAAHMQHWTAGVLESGRNVVAVLGFCAGSVFATSLATHLRGSGSEEPLLVLFDPERPTTTTLADQLANAGATVQPLLTPNEAASLDSSLAAARATSDVAAAATRLIGAYDELVQGPFLRAGLNQRYRDELARSFRSLMDYLTAAGSADFAAARHAADVVYSEHWPEAVNEPATMVRLPIEHGSLLRSDRCREVLSDLLERRAAASTGAAA